jgi:hypothetical protein
MIIDGAHVSAFLMRHNAKVFWESQERGFKSTRLLGDLQFARRFRLWQLFSIRKRFIFGQLATVFGW